MSFAFYKTIAGNIPCW